MAASSFAYEIQAVILQKFGTLVSGAALTADKSNSIDITLQALEIAIFQSIFSPVIKAELAVIDPVGLITNFPISGEEALIIQYRDTKNDRSHTLYMVIDSVTDINHTDDARTVAYMINASSIEAWANAKQTVQHGYVDTVPQIARKIYDEHVTERLQKVFPSYPAKSFNVEDNDSQSQTFVVPNIHPFSAISMLAEMAVSETDGKYTYLFYENFTGFQFRTLQGLYDYSTRGGGARSYAEDNKYVYYSNEIQDPRSQLANEGRVVTNLVTNRRLSSLQKLTQGYYHNSLFEINLAQKAFWAEQTHTEDAKTIYTNKLNNEVYSQLCVVEGDEKEDSNRTKYILTNHRENDDKYPVGRSRYRWGKDLISSTAMAQIDFTVTIPGTNMFEAGDLFYMEVPEMHGFTDMKEDDLISGLFVITEVKHLLMTGGYHSTVLRINKDSYYSTIERGSRYAS